MKKSIGGGLIRIFTVVIVAFVWLPGCTSASPYDDAPGATLKGQITGLSSFAGKRCSIDATSPDVTTGLIGVYADARGQWTQHVAVGAHYNIAVSCQPDEGTGPPSQGSELSTALEN